MSSTLSDPTVSHEAFSASNISEIQPQPGVDHLGLTTEVQGSDVFENTVDGVTRYQIAVEAIGVDGQPARVHVDVEPGIVIHGGEEAVRYVASDGSLRKYDGFRRAPRVVRQRTALVAQNKTRGTGPAESTKIETDRPRIRSGLAKTALVDAFARWRKPEAAASRTYQPLRERSDPNDGNREVKAQTSSNSTQASHNLGARATASAVTVLSPHNTLGGRGRDTEATTAVVPKNPLFDVAARLGITGRFTPASFVGLNHEQVRASVAETMREYDRLIVESRDTDLATVTKRTALIAMAPKFLGVSTNNYDGSLN